MCSLFDMACWCFETKKMDQILRNSFFDYFKDIIWHHFLDLEQADKKYEHQQNLFFVHRNHRNL
jgi:hypothetical protein